MKINEIKSFFRENRNFSYLWASQILSQVTIYIMNFVLATRIYEKTGSTLAVSLLWIFFYLPSFFLGPFSGYFVDIWSRKKTLLLTNILEAIIIFMFLFVRNKIYLFYPMVFLYSLVDQFYYPAEAASLPWLVKKKNLPFANSLFVITSQCSLILGIGLSGVLMHLFGMENPIVLSVIFLFLAALAVNFLPKEQKILSQKKYNFSNFLVQIKIGYKFIQKNRLVLFPMMLITLFQLLLLILAVTLPGFATELLNIKISDAGPLLIIPLGLGAVLGTYLVTKFSGKLRKGFLVKRGMIGAFLSFMLFSLVLPFLGDYRVFFAMAVMVVLGLSIVFILVPNQTLIQESTPNFLRGRIFGAWNFLHTLAILPSLLFSATIVDVLGTGLFIFLSGILILLLVLCFNRVENWIINDDSRFQNGNK